MKTEYDIELLEVLERKIEFEFECNTNEYFKILSKQYSNKFNRIDWYKNGFIFHKVVDDEQKKQKCINGFLKGIVVSFPQLLIEQVIFIGDSLTNIAYKMIFSDFINVNEYFLSIPQHSYVYFSKSKKCINYTFEDELFFGSSKD